VTALMKRGGGECPDPETIAAHLDGRLTGRERAWVIEHLAACEDCYTVFTESAQTHGPAGAARMRLVECWRAWLTAPRLAWSAAVMALATAACVWLLVGSGAIMPLRQPNQELQAMTEALLSDRVIEGRLTGGFAYVHVRGPIRSGGPSAPILSPDVRIAAAHSEKMLAGISTPRALHTRGIASLITGDLDRAVPMIERAVDRSVPDAEMLSDLSAAYLARAERDDRRQDLEKALAAADRAVKADRVLAEGLFNRALALERLSLTDEARAAWEDYLQIDNRSGWADEARTRLAAIR
jgi:tetratricopeptide (TPR) repeat protein